MKPGHYRAVSADQYFNVGDRVQLIGERDGKFVFVRHDRKYAATEAEFRAQFEPHPDGPAAYMAELMAAGQDLTDVSSELSALRGQLADVHLGLNASGEVGGLAGLILASGEPDVPAVPSGEPGALAVTATPMQQARAAALGVQLRAQRAKEEIEVRRTHLEQVSKEALTAARALLEPIEAYVKKLGETVWTLELYAGTEEVITQVLAGENAPVSEPLVIRQGVLSMAEESAVMLDDGGMDAQDIGKFDAWLQEKPERVDYFLPERKGVVAFVARWDAKEYSDPYQTAAIAAENPLAHLLIRNGENVYRVQADLRLGRLLFPTHAEFMELFTAEKWEGDRRVRVPLEPGSPAYLKAEATADSRRRHYYRLALILQGLVDRTAVFHPLPEDETGAERVLITRERDYLTGRIRALEDVGMALGDLRETFAEFVARVNGDLVVGRRVVTALRRYGQYTTFGEGSSRFSPRNAEAPPFGKPLTIEAERNGDLVVRYPRGETWVGRGYDGEYREPKNRASVRLRRDDAGVLAFDHADVTPETLRAFLSRRTERHRYLDMIPLIKSAVRALESERDEQRPFLALLARVGVDKLGLPEGEAVTLAQVAVDAYRTRYKLHRTLVVTDAEAFAACAQGLETLYAAREARGKREAAGEFTRVLTQALADEPDAMLVAHVEGSVYLSVTPERAGERLYARTRRYRVTRGAVTQTGQDDWRTLDRSLTHLHALHRTPALDHWRFRGNTAGVPTGPELALLDARALDDVRETVPTPLAVTRLGYRLLVYYPHRDLDRSYPLRVLELRMDRRPDGVRWKELPGGSSGRVAQWRKKDAFERKPDDGLHPWQADGSVVLHVDAELYGTLDAQFAADDAQRRAQSQAEKAAQEALKPLHEAARAAWWEAQRQAFLTAYGAGNAHLWEDHRKSVREDNPKNPYRTPALLRNQASNPLYAALVTLALAEKPLYGPALEIITRARALNAELPDLTEQQTHALRGLLVLPRAAGTP